MLRLAEMDDGSSPATGDDAVEELLDDDRRIQA
jgi:hypothetical protein